MDAKLLSGALGAELSRIDLKDSSEENFKVKCFYLETVTYPTFFMYI